MTFQRHIVRRQLIELEIPARMDRVDIQNRIARLFHDRLVPVLDRHLSLKSQPGSTDKIERLEIDLGKLHVSRLEQDLIERIEEELQTQLGSIEVDLEPAVVEIENEKQRKGSDVELITYFLQTGAFPWWAVDTSTSALEQAFENVARSGQAELRRLLNHSFHDDQILQRTVYACSEKILERIVEVCLPAEAAKLFKAKQDIGSSLGVRWSKPKLRQIWWYCVIRSAVLPPSQTQADIVPGIVQLFVRLAGLSLNETQAMDDSEILLQEDLTLSNDGIKIQRETNLIFELTEQLGILSGSMPTIGPLLSNEGLQQVIERLHRIEKAIAKEGERESATGSTDRWKRTMQDLIAIQKIIGSQADRPYDDSKQLQAINPESAKLSLQAEVASGIERIKDELNRLSSRYNIPAENKKSSPQARDRMQASLKKILQRPTKEASRSRKLYDAFSDSDKLYIENAGLVLLWPFLNRFFTNLELSDDKAFVNEDAAERACLILQYLAEGEAENIFEAQLPLNKIICGLDLYQPVNTQWEMEADEKEIADDLLEAVLENAPLWKSLSPDGFRQAYLQREAILSTRDGHWLLQVKRETHDVMVDRLPWTIQVVKLPWMEHLIFVEWQQT